MYCSLREKAFLLIVLMLMVPGILVSQNSRIRSLAGMTYALEDEDNSLDLYDFGGNPAWLLRDERSSWLRILPCFSNVWGDYRRLYEPARSLTYGTGFNGVQTLGENGTFRGSAVYTVEKRRLVYRSVKRSPYAGEAFFLTDTTTGDFTYNGPTVGFMYSIEPLPGLLIGASVGYEVLDGLKSVYSRTKTLYREVGADIGLAYLVSDRLAVGVTFAPSDAQERIEAKSEDLLDVELFNYRGETYSFMQRGSTVDHKVTTAGRRISVQASWQPEAGSDIALRTEYGLYERRILVTRGLEKEKEDGLASIERYAVVVAARNRASEDLSIGGCLAYYGDNSWSKYSPRELALWEWTQRRWGGGAGFTYRLIPGALLAGAEYEFSYLKSDSSKYIDNRYARRAGPCHLVRVGAEYSISPAVVVRAGYIFRHVDVDLVTGGDRVSTHTLTAGFGFDVVKEIRLDVDAEYGSTAPSAGRDGSRAAVSALATLKISSF